MHFSLTDYDYTLPPERIAQEAAHPADSALMMVIDRSQGKIIHEGVFREFSDFLNAEDCVIFNDTRVIPSRLRFSNGMQKRTDGAQRYFSGEIFFLKWIDSERFEARIFPGKTFEVGSTVRVFDLVLSVDSATPDGRVLRVISGSLKATLETYGQMPLPPYVEYSKEKERDYQTIFARNAGSVAAPTASLHFTEDILKKMALKGIQHDFITLHVGLGTFQEIKTDDIREYAIHSESCSISLDIFTLIATTKRSGNQIITVGTTATRTIESLPYVWHMLGDELRQTFGADTKSFWNSLSRDDNEYIERLYILNDHISFDTGIYLFEGKPFRIVNGIVTNFHLPRSSLLVMISAFVGYDATRKIYEHAIEKKYRFYSFGDGMLIR